MKTTRLACVILLSTLHSARGGEARAPAEEFSARCSSLEGRKDAKSWLALAAWAEDRLLLEEREKALRAALELEPGNAEAHELLDEKLWEGAWMPAAEAEAKEIEANEAKGLVYYGSKWVPEKEANRLREADLNAVGLTPKNRIDTPHLTVYSEWTLGPSLRLAATLERSAEAYVRLYKGCRRLKARPDRIRVFVFTDDTRYRTYLVKAEKQENGKLDWLLERNRKENEQAKKDKKPLPQTLTSRLGKTEPEVEGPSVSDYREGGTLCVLAKFEGEEGEAFRKLLNDAVTPMVLALDEKASDLRFTGTPPWAYKGREFLFGYSVAGSRVFPGALRIGSQDAILALLEASVPDMDLGALLSLPNEYEFQKTDGFLHGAQAMSFVHFLMLGEEGKHAEGFRRYLSGLPSKGSLKEFEKAVGKVAELEAPFKRHVLDVMIPAARAAQGK